MVSVIDTQTHFHKEDTTAGLPIHFKWSDTTRPIPDSVCMLFQKMLTGVSLPTALICVGAWAWGWACGTWEGGGGGGGCRRSWKCAGVMVFPGSCTPVAGEATH